MFIGDYFILLELDVNVLLDLKDHDVKYSASVSTVKGMPYIRHFNLAWNLTCP